MKKTDFQQQYMQELADTSVKLLNDKYREQGAVVFKAPSGFGKTYMISQAIPRHR